MVTERFTTTWRGNISPTTASNTTTAMSPTSIFLIMSCPPHTRNSTAAALLQLSGCTLHIVRQSHRLDQSELFFDEVDVFFFALLNVNQQIAGHIILDAFAVGDCGFVHGVRFHLAAKVAPQNL